jgi:hypothetical protein
MTGMSVRHNSGRPVTDSAGAALAQSFGPNAMCSPSIASKLRFIDHPFAAGRARAGKIVRQCGSYRLFGRADRGTERERLASPALGGLVQFR